VTETADRILTREFVLLNAVVFLGFSNIALFFQFYSYLQSLPIDPAWFGFLISLFSVLALALRPLISPLLHPGNARAWMTAGTVVSAGALVGYAFAHSLVPMVLVRSLHGVGFVVMATGVMAMVVAFIPASRSGQAFGIISVNTLLPNALLPPLLDLFTRALGGFDRVLAAAGLAMLLVLPCILAIRPPSGVAAGGGAPGFSPGAFRENFGRRRVPLLLGVTLLFFTSYTMIFFFLKDFGRHIGVPNPGLFYTLATAIMIGVRVAAGAVLDRLDKVRLLSVVFLFMAAGYGALPLAGGPVFFYAVACLLGLAWGASTPLMNAIIFESSLPRYRGLNLNLSTWMIDGGYVIGPILGGLVLAGEEKHYGLLYGLCAAMILAAVAVLRIARGISPPEP
jgi:predicted MFS family arabinose efflux permease